MNNLLKNKIELSNKKYQEILNKIEAKKKEDIETNLNLQIQELNKSIKANNSETERYKKMIDQLKTKIEFKENLDRVSSIQYILKQETLKNNDLQNELNALKRINKAQEKYIDTYNKEGKLIFEGIFFNGIKNGKGKEYYNEQLVFDGEYLNNKQNDYISQINELKMDKLNLEHENKIIKDEIKE